MIPTDEDAIAFLRDLVATPSVSGGESAAVALFASTAARWGLRSAIDEAGNAVAETGGQVHAIAARVLVLLGHIDTVAGDIPVRIEDNILHGRGSVDAKGSLAAMLVAAARVQAPPHLHVIVAAAVGEETPHSPGARFLATRLRPDACIIGEPSGRDGVTLGYKGRLVLKASIRRDSAHSAGPHGSAGDAAIDLWTRITTRIAHLNTGHHGAFDVIQATIQSLATRADGLTVHTDLMGGFRLPTWMPPNRLEEELTSVAAETEDVTCAFIGHEHAFATDRNDAVVRALSGAIRARGARPQPKLKTGTSDMNVVAPVWKCHIAAYGPGDSALDHTPQEQLHLDEFLTSIHTLEATMHTLAEEWSAGVDTPASSATAR
jgi:[amino group carrier protein]-lysine/ornithine hydrolase